jgi:spore germination protein KA
MNIIYEILKEAGVRLPRPVGQAVSIVGALVVGEAAVSAGLVGAPMVIVISVTAVSAFVVSSINDTTTIMRFFYMILAGSLGMFGIMIGAAGFLTHLAAMRSFGVPYLSPIAPISTQDMKDVFIRAPWWAMHTRPRVIGWKNLVRQKYNLIPEPNKDDDNK